MSILPAPAGTTSGAGGGRCGETGVVASSGAGGGAPGSDAPWFLSVLEQNFLCTV